MTLLVALRGSDGLTLAADSRGTFGDPRGVTAQNDSQTKAHVVAPHVATLQAGAGEIGTLIVEQLIPQLQQQGIDGVTRVLEALRSHSRNSYNEWFPTVPAIQAPQPAMMGQAPVRPDLVFIVGGYELNADGSAGDLRIYQLASGQDFAPMLHEYGFAVAGVAQYALYLLNRLYEPDRSVQELTSLAAYVVTETASQDGKVGGPVDVVTVTAEAGCRALEASEVEAVVAQNETRSRALRDSFYEREGRS